MHEQVMGAQIAVTTHESVPAVVQADDGESLRVSVRVRVLARVKLRDIAQRLQYEYSYGTSRRWIISPITSTRTGAGALLKADPYGGAL